MRSDLDLHAREIRIRGKGGTAWTVKIGHQAARSLDRYLRARAPARASAPAAAVAGSQQPGAAEAPPAFRTPEFGVISRGCCHFPVLVQGLLRGPVPECVTALAIVAQLDVAGYNFADSVVVTLENSGGVIATIPVPPEA